MISSNLLLLIVAAIILLGFVGEIAFRAKRIPDMLFLLLIGILLHYSRIIPLRYFSTLESFLGFFGIVALTLIVFGGVLRLDIVKYGHSVTKGIIFASMDLIFVMAAATPFFYYFMHISFIISLLLAAILGETSSTFIIPLLSRIKIDEDVRHTIEIEAIFTSVLNIIAVLLILNIIGHQSNFLGIASYLFASISEGIVLGGSAGVIWLIIIKQASVPHYYMATVAVLLALWAISDYLNASAILSAFIFSVIIANSLPLSKIIKVSGVVDAEKLTLFNQEISFFVLTFFYVYIGLFVNVLDFSALMYALFIVAVLLVARLVQTYSVDAATKWFKKDKPVVTSFFQRGPTVIVLLGVLLTVDPAVFNAYANTIFYTVILTILYASILFTSMSKGYEVKKE